ncbi:MAG: LysR substrate-binding domain-containing protein [Rhodospirillaceae bacterium]|nr:LysR substrate-binding domain-containing protein [Rhodospirillaceae bacterium]
MDTIDGMKAFARVIESGSFTKAARRLGISTALASKYVRQLETRLGAQLLNRTTRSVRPTKVGQAYWERCNRILSEFDELEDSVADQHVRPRGQLRIAGSRAFGEDMLVPAIGVFMESHPEITVDLTLEERMVDIIAEGFDVAIRAGELADSSLIGRRIASCPYYICASPEYLTEHGTPNTPQDLVDHRCIINTGITPANDWQFSINGQKSQVTVPSTVRVNAARSTATLVKAGQGIGLCLHSAVKDDLESGALIRVLRKFEAYDQSVYAIYPKSHHLSGKVRAFVDHMLATFADYRA